MVRTVTIVALLLAVPVGVALGYAGQRAIDALVGWQLDMEEK